MNEKVAVQDKLEIQLQVMQLQLQSQIQASQIASLQEK
jgi:hypothetical protein